MNHRASPTLFAFAFALVLPACSPIRDGIPDETTARPPTPEVVTSRPGTASPVLSTAENRPLETTAAPAPEAAPPNAPKVTRATAAGLVFEGISFDSRTHRMLVVDQPSGPGSRFADASVAANAHGGIAAVNAGFFTPEGDPLGLVISRGEKVGAWNSSSLGSGFWHEDSAGRSAISRRESLGRAGAKGMRELIQAGPMLVDGFRPVSGLESTKSSVRVAILWDGRHRWWIGKTDPCTLVVLARAIATGNPAGWKTFKALNLDGGRSADLWISGQVPGGPILRRPVWNRQVRNFLVIVPR